MSKTEIEKWVEDPGNMREFQVSALGLEFSEVLFRDKEVEKNLTDFIKWRLTEMPENFTVREMAELACSLGKTIQIKLVPLTIHPTLPEAKP